jgi:hypothetical protein
MPMVEQEDAPRRRRRKKRARRRGRQELEAEEEVAGIHAADARRLFLENYTAHVIRDGTRFEGKYRNF